MGHDRRGEPAQPAQHPSVDTEAERITAPSIEPDRWMPGSFTLVVDGTPQSHVNLDDPSELFFEYIQRIGHVIDLLGIPGEPITAVHLGAGALTLPRYVEATRPGLAPAGRRAGERPGRPRARRTALVEAAHPGAARRCARGARQAARPGCAARSTCSSSTSSAGRARPPTSRASSSTARRVALLAAAAGSSLVNVADGPGLAFARGQAATLLAAYRARRRARRDAGSQGPPVRQHRVGRLARTPLPLEWMPRLLAGGPHPAKVVDGRRTARVHRGRPSSPTRPPSRRRRPRRTSSRSAPGAGLSLTRCRRDRPEG